LADFTPYAAFNYLQRFGNGLDSSFFRVTPGIRSFVGWGTYFIVGYEIPVTGPRPFDQRLTFILSKGW